MNTSPLYEQLLSAPLVKKDFVIGEKLCNYELYITEILNASPWMAKHYVLPFVPPESESNGECDAYAGDYGLDYKLIASKTALQARSILSMQVSKAANGLTFFHAPKRSEGMDITRIAQALRGKTIEELLVAQANTSKKQGIDNDIKQYIKREVKYLPVYTSVMSISGCTVFSYLSIVFPILIVHVFLYCFCDFNSHTIGEFFVHYALRFFCCFKKARWIYFSITDRD